MKQRLLLFVVLLFLLAACAGLGGLLGQDPGPQGTDTPGPVGSSAQGLGLRTEIETTGRIVCGDGRPLRNARIELYDSDQASPAVKSDIGDERMDADYTDSEGKFRLLGSADELDRTRPDVYLRIVYENTLSGSTSDGRAITSKVVVVGDDPLPTSSKTRYDNTPAHWDFVSPRLVLGDVQLGGDCAIYNSAQDMVNDWMSMTGTAFPAPRNEARIQRWTALLDTKEIRHTAYTEYDIVRMPTRYATGEYGDIRRLIFHELAHAMRFGLHSGRDHWNLDLGNFQYARVHTLDYHAAGDNCSQSCAEGYAFSEGWSDFWELRAGLPGTTTAPELDSYAPAYDPRDAVHQWETEGNVRDRLRFMAFCLGGRYGNGYAQLAQVMINHAGEIHSLPDFEKFARQDLPEVSLCLDSGQGEICNTFCKQSSECDKAASSCKFCRMVANGDVSTARCTADAALPTVAPNPFPTTLQPTLKPVPTPTPARVCDIRKMWCQYLDRCAFPAECDAAEASANP